MELTNTTRKYYTMDIEPRVHQIRVEDARNLRLIDLFTDTDDNGHKYLSRADLILIFTLYPRGIEEFLEDYKTYVEEEVETKGYKVVNKPHFYLKNLIG